MTDAAPELLVGWREIAGALGVSEDVTRRLHKQRNLPVFRAGQRPPGVEGGRPGRVYTTRQALRIWATAEALLPRGTALRFEGRLSG